MKNILLINSDINTLKKWLTAFQAAGIQATITVEEAHGWEVFKMMQRKFELVLMDTTLMGGDGLKLIKLISSWAPKVPILLIANSIKQEDCKMYMLKGVREFLLIPVQEEKVIKKINELTATNKMGKSIDQFASTTLPI